ncbi:MAG: hypothetical protein J2P15_08070, partial [Micromonosporaceae bacterium]|nr:hypothetical protein [Micromonosporaceae bacterium]
MGEQFRQAIDEELAGENVPSVAGLIDRAVHDGHRLRRLRTVRTAAGGGFAAAVLAGVVVLVAGVPAHGPHAGGSGAVGGGTARRVVSLQANNGKVIRLDAASQQRVDAFVQCMREHGVDLGADFGRP